MDDSVTPERFGSRSPIPRNSFAQFEQQQYEEEEQQQQHRHRPSSVNMESKREGKTSDMEGVELCESKLPAEGAESQNGRYEGKTSTSKKHSQMRHSDIPKRRAPPERDSWKKFIPKRGRESTRRGSIVWEREEPPDILLRILMVLCCQRRALQKMEDRECRAAMLVRNAVHGRPTAFPSKDSLIARVIYHAKLNRFVTIVVAIIYMVIAEWEEPAIHEAPTALIKAVEVAMPLYFAVQLRLEWLYFDKSVFLRKKWSVAKAVVLMLTVISLTLSWSIPGFPHFSRVLRPVFFVDRMRNVRKIASNIMETIPKILNVMILLWFVIVLFGVLAHVFFGGIGSEAPKTYALCSTFSESCDDYFNTVDNSVVHLFILSTTANFPEIMMPVYRRNSWNALFFIIFILINVYLIFSLTLAVAFTEFKALTEKKVLERFAYLFQGCDDAFTELTRPQMGIRTVSTDESAQEDLSREEWIKFYGKLRPIADDELAARLFDIMDTQNRGNLMEDKRGEDECVRNPVADAPEEYASGDSNRQTQPRQTRFVAKLKSRRWWQKFLDSFWATMFFDAMILANCVFVITSLQLNATQDSFDGTKEDRILIALQRSTFGVFVFEVLSKMAAFGPVKYWKLYMIHKFDAVVLVLSIVGEIMDTTVQSVERYTGGVTFFRIVRLVRILRFLPDFTVMIKSFRDTLPVLWQYLLVLVSAIYGFAIIGMELFAGKLTCGDTLDESISYCELNFRKLNFDSLGRAVVTLFHQMVVNDFPVVMEGAVEATNKGARLYFIIYVLSSTVLVLNVLVAFIIESFSVQRERNAKCILEEHSELHGENRKDLLNEESSNRVSEEWDGRADHPGPVLKLLRKFWRGQKKPDTEPYAAETDAIDVDYWKHLLLNSDVDFSKWHIWRNSHTYDIYKRLYADSIKQHYPEVFDLYPEASEHEQSSPVERGQV